MYLRNPFRIVFHGARIVRPVLLGLDAGASVVPEVPELHHRSESIVRPCQHTIHTFAAGWMTVVAWQALSAALAFVTGALIQSLTILSNPNYDHQPWQGSLMAWGILVFAFIINTIARGLLPRLEALIIVVHILGAVAVIATLLVMSDHVSSETVWTEFYNGGGWSSQGLSTVIGILMPIYFFTGVDGAIHVSTNPTSKTQNETDSHGDGGGDPECGRRGPKLNHDQCLPQRRPRLCSTRLVRLRSGRRRCSFE